MPLRIGQGTQEARTFVLGFKNKSKASKAAAMDTFCDHVIERADEDIRSIVAHGLGADSNLKANVFDPLRMMIDAVDALHAFDSSHKEMMMQRLRSLVSVIEYRLDEAPDDPSFLLLLMNAKSLLGEVPVLNDGIRLPYKVDQQDLRAMPNPSRRDGIGFRRGKKGADGRATSYVRRVLMQEEKDRGTELEGQGFCFSTGDYFDFGNLDADHAQPSVLIIRRQMELIQAMRDDPMFARDMRAKAARLGKKYFTEGKVIYGTRQFYMDYHNCADNIWFMSRAANIGGSKGSHDFITWLGQHKKFGRPFFEWVRQHKGGFNMRSILITTGDGTVLAKAAQEFYQAHYAHEVQSIQYMNLGVKANFMALIEGSHAIEDGRERRRAIVDQTARAVLASMMADPTFDLDLGEIDAPSLSAQQMTEMIQRDHSLSQKIEKIVHRVRKVVRWQARAAYAESEHAARDPEDVSSADVDVSSHQDEEAIIKIVIDEMIKKVVDSTMDDVRLAGASHAQFESVGGSSSSSRAIKSHISQLDDSLYTFVASYKDQSPAQKRAANLLFEEATSQVNLDIQHVVQPEGLSRYDIDRGLIKPLNKLLGLIHAERPHSAPADKLIDRLRSLISILHKRLDEVSSRDQVKLRNFIGRATRQIGTVPKLNPRVAQAATAFLPEPSGRGFPFQAAVATPVRGSGRGQIKFRVKQMGSESHASVRWHLMQEERREHGDNQLPEKGYCFASGDYYDFGNLDVDHGQPSKAIIEAQVQLIQAMRDDPLLLKEMLSDRRNKGYFKVIDGVVYGTYKFFMDYHNCVGNVWFMVRGENSCGAKGSKDFIQWLRGHPRFGKKFFDWFEGQHGSVDENYIIAASPNGTMLAEAAREYYRLTHRLELRDKLGLHASILSGFKQAIDGVSVEDEPQVVARMAVATATVKAASRFKATPTEEGPGGNTRALDLDQDNPMLRGEARPDADREAASVYAEEQSHDADSSSDRDTDSSDSLHDGQAQFVDRATAERSARENPKIVVKQKNLFSHLFRHLSKKDSGETKPKTLEKKKSVSKRQRMNVQKPHELTESSSSDLESASAQAGQVNPLPASALRPVSTKKVTSKKDGPKSKPQKLPHKRPNFRPR